MQTTETRIVPATPEHTETVKVVRCDFCNWEDIPDSAMRRVCICHRCKRHVCTECGTCKQGERLYYHPLHCPFCAELHEKYTSQIHKTEALCKSAVELLIAAWKEESLVTPGTKGANE